LSALEDESLRKYIADSGKDYPFSRGGKVRRQANPQDINDQHHLDKSAKDEATFCREQIKDLAINMKIVAVEHILGGERAVFYFMSEDRVDFRELVKRLARQYHTRIEMRQIGARDEARLMGDYERCGRQCCCREYLKLLKPISMRMAKVQKATLDPAKISGRCGRLMCCLRYEDKEYEELRRKLPHRSTWVRTEDGVVGKVLSTQIITQLVRLELIDKRQVAVPNEEIV
jgi:cell fate regulator YaaT (PSP1 superfamily)